ncbi:tRNA 2-thiocytidine(32) synthetase TtcA, partial [Yersinia enterocolitica]|nr:tRNA 2-thiocytidine(32) synthetase TtcA [Yersinia enterocolitica]
HNSEIVDGGDLAFDCEELPLQPVGWQPEDAEDGATQPLVRLDVLEIK